LTSPSDDDDDPTRAGSTAVLTPLEFEVAVAVGGRMVVGPDVDVDGALDFADVVCMDAHIRSIEV
jgi:hypothetical protein